MITLKINERFVEVEEGSTLLEACLKAQIEVPVFCYHPKLSSVGNCRMCLVEVEQSSDLVASCVFPASQGMVVSTTTSRVQNARKGTLSLLLLNHPLECPVCDQAGECDLQDIAHLYGPEHGYDREFKKTFCDKDFGPFIQTHMDRCILCSRCTRFSEEIAGVSQLGILGRGEMSAIVKSVGDSLSSELSGNLIDICPVGALTSKPAAFKFRPWALRKTETIDCLDAVGASIRVDTQNLEVMRILPRFNADTNEDWISDKTRFFYDGLKYQRLDRPYLREKERLVPVSWEEAFKKIGKVLSSVASYEIGAISGNLSDVEAVFALKDLMEHLGSPHRDCCADGVRPFKEFRALYLFNTRISGIEQADACLLIGANPRTEATVLNARIRKRYLQGDFNVGLIGSPTNLTYPYTHISSGPDGLDAVFEERHPWANVLKSSKNPMIILGPSALRHSERDFIQAAALRLAQKCGALREDWNGYNILHIAAGRVGALDVGFFPKEQGWGAEKMYEKAATGGLKFLYLLGEDETDISHLKSSSCFIVYQGHHGDRSAQYADLILPGSAFTEKDALYVNMEGRIQNTVQALFPPGDAKEDWKILRALSEHLKKKLDYDTREELREKIFEEVSFSENGSLQNFEDFIKKQNFQKLSRIPFETFIKNYYMTDPITRASPTMARATEAFILKTQQDKG